MRLPTPSATAATSLLILLVACSSPAPSPSASAAIAVLPEPVCDPPPQVWRVDANGQEELVDITLTCEDAVEAATAALPAGHLPIVAIEFHFGAYCPPGAHCPFADPQNGYVVFVTASRGPQPGIWLGVAANEAGGVRITAGAQPFPPLFGPGG